jgi:hypothetical protein
LRRYIVKTGEPKAGKTRQAKQGKQNKAANNETLVT